ncbi:unnamed protein product [Protopolystoma xenopodis]|uniref:Fcf2 pre-rRNA processing C-terminal domain-containing protein n=1 Tax=Protopolystoma xenopodis TaxID=117903 RepID=A0A3S5AS65_9PLAT|nr:unnamed protein product [Protopolystoma xenopodis]
MRAEKRNRREMRKKSLAKWYDLPKTELTKDDKEDLEFIKLRRVLTNVSEGGSHVKRSDSRCTHFQRGVVVDDPGDFHHRLPKKLRGQTLVDEICRNAEIMREQRLRYRKVKASQNIKKAAIRRRNAQIHRKLAKKGDRGRKMQLIPMK